MTRYQWEHTPPEQRPQHVRVESVRLGQLACTRAVNDAIADDANFAQLTIDVLVRYAHGDWGDVDAEGWRANDRSLDDGTRLLSAYESPTPCAPPSTPATSGCGSSSKPTAAPPWSPSSSLCARETSCRNSRASPCHGQRP